MKKVLNYIEIINLWIIWYYIISRKNALKLEV